MKIKFAILLIIYVIGLLLLTSCVSASQTDTIKLTNNKLKIYENLIVNINLLRYDLSSVKIDGNNYSPADKSKVMTELKISIDNSSEKDYEYSELMAVEMVFINKSGDMKLTQHVFILYGNTNPDKIFPKGQISKETLCFIHNKGDIPVAITINRANHIMFINEENPNYTDVTAFLTKHLNIQVMLTLASFTSFEKIDAFRKENGLDIDDSNKQGLTLLHIGILSKNDSVVVGAIKNGCDLHKKISYNFEEIEPIHLAFLENNRNAVKILINAGADVNQLGKGKNSPAVIAVRSNNLASLKLLKEHGVDLTKVMIPMNWRPEIPALKLAKDRNMTEIAQYLESLEKP
ncbi:MAG: ankyrin repeat domain-containing protein [Treponema sp.]|jgi:hypothetical protein|nr:ankyrin repeat domain-containing protein [Treponema sp.]